MNLEGWKLQTKTKNLFREHLWDFGQLDVVDRMTILYAFLPLWLRYAETQKLYMHDVMEKREPTY